MPRTGVVDTVVDSGRLQLQLILGEIVLSTSNTLQYKLSMSDNK
jgi:hypothetical protein